MAGNTQPLDEASRYYIDPRNSLGYLARIMFRSFSRSLERRTLAEDISAGQWRFLRQLWVEDGITQRELSKRVGMREPTTVVALTSMEKAGLIVRRKVAEDRRKTYVFLTPHARQLEAVLMPMNVEVHTIATQGLSADEVDTLRNLMRRVADNLSGEVDRQATLADFNP